MIAAAVPRREHALAVLHADLSAGARRFVAWVQEHADWRTGLMPREVSSRGMACELRAGHRQTKRHGAELRRAGWLAVVDRGPRGEPRYALTTPTRPLRWIDEETLDCDVSEFDDAPPVEPAPRIDATWWGRAKELAAGVVRGVSRTWTGEEAGREREEQNVRPQAHLHTDRPTAARRGASAFDRQRGGDSASPRCGADGDRGMARGHVAGGDAPPTGPSCARCGGPVEPQRHCYAIPTCYRCLPPPDPIPVAPWPPLHEDSTEPSLDLDVEPVNGAFHVGLTFSEAEWRERAALPGYMRTPGGRAGPGDDAPHRRVELAYRQAYFARFGVQPAIGKPGHSAIKRLIDALGVDRVLDVIREQIDGAPPWRRAPITVQTLASHWPRYRVGATG